MKRLLTLLVAVLASISVGMAGITPEWLEDFEPDTTYTYGDYKTVRAIAEDEFTPQQLGSGFGWMTEDSSALVLQGMETSIYGESVGIDRQLLSQSASASVLSGPNLVIDAENDKTITGTVLSLSKDQNALYSGKLVGGELNEIPQQGYDVNNDGINDDPYSGGHILNWYTYELNGPSWTTNFWDQACVSAYPYVANAGPSDVVTLKEATCGASVTVSLDPEEIIPEGDVVFQIGPDSENYYPDYKCQGDGEYWQGYATSDYPDVEGDDPNKFTPTQQQVGGFPDAPEGALSDSQLTEVAASLSSDATLTNTQTMILGNVDDLWTLDGSASLSGAFENAIVDPCQSVNIDMYGGTETWFEVGMPFVV